MTRLNINASRLSALTAGVVGLLAAGLVPTAAQDQPKQQVPQGWFKACSKQAEVDICNVQNIMTAQTGQLVTGISLIELKGKVNRKVFQVTVLPFAQHSGAAKEDRQDRDVVDELIDGDEPTLFQVGIEAGSGV